MQKVSSLKWKDITTFPELHSTLIKTKFWLWHMIIWYRQQSLRVRTTKHIDQQIEISKYQKIYFSGYCLSHGNLVFMNHFIFCCGWTKVSSLYLASWLIKDVGVAKKFFWRSLIFAWYILKPLDEQTVILITFLVM